MNRKWEYCLNSRSSIKYLRLNESLKNSIIYLNFGRNPFIACVIKWVNLVYQLIPLGWGQVIWCILDINNKMRLEVAISSRNSGFVQNLVIFGLITVFSPNNRFFLTKLHPSSKTTSFVKSSIICACMVSLNKPSFQDIVANNPNSKVGQGWDIS